MHSIKSNHALGGSHSPARSHFRQVQLKIQGHYNIYHHRGYGQNVAGDAAEVSSITKHGAEIHEYQPTHGDIKRAQGHN